MTMVSREPRQIIGHAVSRDKTSQTIQCMVDTAPDAERYCTDGYVGYLDVVYPGKHIFNIHNKKDTEPFPQKRTQNRRKKLNKNTEIG